MRPQKISVGELMQRSYSYDLSDQITQISRQDKTQSGITAYAYDRAGRLTDVTPSAGLAQTEEHYTYDAVGNRTSSQIGGQSQPNWQYNADNQLIQWGQGAEETKLTYSASGQTQTQTRAGQNTTYSYNAADRLA